VNRNSAMRLLTGGREGVAKWNRLHDNGESFPNLDRANLYRADLDGIDLNGINLNSANLIGAKLFGAKLFGAHLMHADFSDANLCWADLGLAQLFMANFNGANLGYADLRRGKFRKANFNNSNLKEANLSHADLREADLRRADLSEAILVSSNLSDADLRRANLNRADLRKANLTRANLGEADLSWTNFHSAILNDAYISDATCLGTVFGNLDVSKIKGLIYIKHSGPSSFGVDTLIKSRGNIPEEFLRGCGLPPWLVLSAKLHDVAMTPPWFVELQYQIYDAWTKGKEMINGCFISYSWSDSDFAEKLRNRLMDEGINVWLDRHDMVAGPIQPQVWKAIQVHQVVILVMSSASIKSDWVENELDMGRQKEKDEGRAVLCPIALDDSWKVKVKASGGSGDPNRQLWLTLTQKLVMDFSSWKTEAFNDEFAKLVRGLKLNYGPNVPPAR
jgi:uncharacterized protein YjbI with pentapeptide repeats